MVFKRCAEIPLSAYGFTFWWGWIFLVIFSPSGISEGFAAVGSQTVWVASMLSTAVGFALLYGLKGSVYARLWSRAVRWGATVVMVASTVLLTWSIAMPETAGWAVLAGSTLGGLTLAYFALPWARQLSMLGAKQSQIALLLSFLGAVLLYFLLSRVPDGVRMGVVAIFPVVLALPWAVCPLPSVSKITRAMGEHGSTTTGSCSSALVLWRLCLRSCSAYFASCCRFQTRLEAAQSADIVFALSAGLGILLLSISLAMGEGIDFSLLFKVALPLVVLGALVFSGYRPRGQRAGHSIHHDGHAMRLAAVLGEFHRASLAKWRRMENRVLCWIHVLLFRRRCWCGQRNRIAGASFGGALSLTTLSIVAVLAMVLSVGWLVTVSGSPGVQDKNEEKLVKSPNGHRVDRLRTIASRAA